MPRGCPLAPVRAEPVLKGGGFSAGYRTGTKRPYEPVLLPGSALVHAHDQGARRQHAYVGEIVYSYTCVYV